VLLYAIAVVPGLERATSSLRRVCSNVSHINLEATVDERVHPAIDGDSGEHGTGGPTLVVLERGRGLLR
jgi:hypothetical protein